MNAYVVYVFKNLPTPLSSVLGCIFFTFCPHSFQGDSGGPLFSTHPSSNNKKWYQIGMNTLKILEFYFVFLKSVELFFILGVVSWGIDCAMPDYPGNKYNSLPRFMLYRIALLRRFEIYRCLYGSSQVLKLDSAADY